MGFLLHRFCRHHEMLIHFYLELFLVVFNDGDDDVNDEKHSTHYNVEMIV